jgi:hypothetical protein
LKKTIHKIQEALAELERVISSYKPEFLARMYRARVMVLSVENRGLFARQSLQREFVSSKSDNLC